MSQADILFTPSAHTNKHSRTTYDHVFAGPSHEELDEFIIQDPTEYKAAPLDDEKLRLMLASAAFSVLSLAHQYDRIVGEDTSGRYPALIIGEAINGIRQHYGLEPAKRSFISGKIPYKEQPKWPYDSDEKMLIVTEYISSGGSSARVLGAVADRLMTMPDFLVIDGEPQNCGMTYGTIQRFIKGGGHVFTGDLSVAHKYVDNRLTFGPSDVWKGVVKDIGYAHADAAPYNEGGTYEHKAQRGAVIDSRRYAKAFGRHIANYYLQNR